MLPRISELRIMVQPNTVSSAIACTWTGWGRPVSGHPNDKLVAALFQVARCNSARTRHACVLVRLEISEVALLNCH